jgi:hypothetical protein
MHLRDPLTGRLRSARAHPFGFLALVATIALIPWTLVYILQLPDHHTAKHWNLAWAGFDLALCAALGVTAWAALKERALLIVGLIVSSTLLVCDAWFDVATSLDTADETITLITALAVEVPLALYFATLAHRYLRTSIRVSRPEYADRALHDVPLARDEREQAAPRGDTLERPASAPS